MDYYCKECGAEVFVSPDGGITRSCGHHHATVIAPRSSVLYGDGVVNDSGLLARATAALQKLVEACRPCRS